MSTNVTTVISSTTNNPTTDSSNKLFDTPNLVNVVIGSTAFVAGITIGISLTILARNCYTKKTKDDNNVIDRVENGQTSSNNGIRLTKVKKSNQDRPQVSTKTGKAATLNNRQNAQGRLRRTNSEQYELAKPLNSSESEHKDVIYSNSKVPQNIRKKAKQTETLTKNRSLETRIKKTEPTEYEFARPNGTISAGEPMVRFAADVVKFETENSAWSKKEEERCRRKYSTDYEFAHPNDTNSGAALEYEVDPMSNLSTGSTRGLDTRQNDERQVESKLQRTDYEMAGPIGSSFHDARFKH